MIDIGCIDAEDAQDASPDTSGNMLFTVCGQKVHVRLNNAPPPFTNGSGDTYPYEYGLTGDIITGADAHCINGGGYFPTSPSQYWFGQTIWPPLLGVTPTTRFYQWDFAVDIYNPSKWLIVLNPSKIIKTFVSWQNSFVNVVVIGKVVGGFGILNQLPVKPHMNWGGMTDKNGIVLPPLFNIPVDTAGNPLAVTVVPE